MQPKPILYFYRGFLFRYGILHDKIIRQHLINLWDRILVCLCYLSSLYMCKQRFCFKYFHRVNKLSIFCETIINVGKRKLKSLSWVTTILAEFIALVNLRYSKRPKKNSFYKNGPRSRWNAWMLHLSWRVLGRYQYYIAGLP